MATPIRATLLAFRTIAIIITSLFTSSSKVVINGRTPSERGRVIGDGYRVDAGVTTPIGTTELIARAVAIRWTFF